MVNLISRIIASILFLGILLSCNPIPDKSISDPLTPEELSKIFDKDTTFRKTYEFLETANKLVLNSDVKKAEFLALTYRRFHEFFKMADNTSQGYKRMDSTYRAEWDLLVAGYQPKIDSISSYWEHYLSDKRIDEYVYVDFAGVVVYTRYGYTDSFGLKFLVDPYKDYQIDRIKVSYKIIDQILFEDFEKEKKLGIDQVFSIQDFEINRPINGLEEVEIRIRNRNREIFYKLYPDGLEYDKQIIASVDEVVIDGKTIKNKASDIPYVVREYWKDSMDSTNRFDQFTVTSIINEFIDKDFKYQFEYSIQKIKEYLEEKDSLSFKYYFQVVEIVSKIKD